MNKKTHILTCGGTIDKDYGSGKGVYDFHIDEPCVGKILKHFGIDSKSFIITELMRKDSMDMDAKDRRIVSENVLTSRSHKILITHGTDTMIDTGKSIGMINDKIIVIVGASRPYSMKTTDADRNVLFAYNSLFDLENEKKYGVYVAMNDELFPIDNVEKCDDGIFRKTNS